jgi:3-oxoacyl-[acyl-carrier-protein] synthase III
MMIEARHQTRLAIGIEAAAYELPGSPLDIEACAERNGWPRDRVEAIVASGCRYFHAAPDIGEVELATRAVGRLMDEAALAPSEVDLLIHVHTQQFSVPAAPRSLPAEVAQAHGIHATWAASIGQLGCVGIAGGVRAADALFEAYEQADTALVVSVDRVYGEQFRLRERSGLQSDGAACVLVTRECTRNRVGHVAISNHAAWHSGSKGAIGVERQMIAMEWQYTREIIRAACEGSGTPLERFGRVLLNNADLRGWHSLARAMGVPRARLFEDNIFQHGHVCCSDFAINLADVGLAAVDAGMHVIGVMQSYTGACGAITLHPFSGDTDDAN